MRVVSHLFSLCTLFSVTTLLAAQPQIIWQRQFSPASISNTTKDVAVDSQGNAIVAAESNAKGFIHKYDPDGKLLWKFELETIYPKGHYKRIYGAVTDERDFIYYAGYAQNIYPTYDLPSENEHYCYGKISPSGELIRKYRREIIYKDSVCYDIAITPGLLAVGGFIEEGMSKKARQTSGTFIGLLDYDLKLKRRIDDDRTKTPTSKHARNSATKVVTGVAFTSDKGLMVTGRVNQSGDSHRYLQRRKPNLQPLWTVRLNNHGRLSDSPAIVVDSTDSAYVSMCSKAGSRSHSKDQIYVAKYSPDGNILWEVEIPSSADDDSGRRMAIDADGSLLVACEYNNRAAIARITSTGTLTQRPHYLYSEKLSNSGTANAVAIAPDGAVYVTGDIEGTENLNLLQKEPTGGDGSPWEHYSSGHYNFLVKLSFTGSNIASNSTNNRADPSGSLADFANSVLSGVRPTVPKASSNDSPKNTGPLAYFDVLFQELNSLYPRLQKKRPDLAPYYKQAIEYYTKERDDLEKQLTTNEVIGFDKRIEDPKILEGFRSDIIENAERGLAVEIIKAKQALGTLSEEQVKKAFKIALSDPNWKKKGPFAEAYPRPRQTTRAQQAPPKPTQPDPFAEAPPKPKKPYVFAKSNNILVELKRALEKFEAAGGEVSQTYKVHFQRLLKERYALQEQLKQGVWKSDPSGFTKVLTELEQKSSEALEAFQSDLQRAQQAASKPTQAKPFAKIDEHIVDLYDAHQKVKVAGGKISVTNGVQLYRLLKERMDIKEQIEKGFWKSHPDRLTKTLSELERKSSEALETFQSNLQRDQ